MILPSSKKDLIAKAIDIKETCRASASQRAALARVQNMWIQTGQNTGQRALINTLYAHNDRLASHLFSPAELRFTMDFEAHYPPETLHKGEMAARVITREWERKDIDMLFGSAVGVSLDYGAAIIKQMWGHSGVEATLLMPWQFGVYREDINNLDDQEAVCESGHMTVHEVWRRISHLSNAEDLYKRIIAHARRDAGEGTNTSFFHQVISTSTLNTDLTTQRVQPGGVVQLANDPSSALLGPEINADLVAYHEIYVKDEATGDYVTILLLEPDVLISPQFKRVNQFAPKVQPFTLVQANRVPGYMWGRSECVDLIAPQGLLATWMEDIRRVMGVQYDKLLAFGGSEGMTDELYDQFRASGYANLGPGGSVQDLTPELPSGAFQAIEMLKRQMEEVSGFGNMLGGQGEPGVRSGDQADKMIKMASPRLKDRALLIERQCATAADKTLDLLQAKDAQAYFTDPSEGAVSEFLLADLPDDLRITVDSHSSSPIFAENHQELIAFGMKAGFIGGDSALDLLPFPSRELLKQRYVKMQKEKAAMLEKAEKDPALAKILQHSKH